jgi:hypothetical protein
VQHDWHAVHQLPPAAAVPQAQAAAVGSYDPDTKGFVDTDGQRGVFASDRRVDLMLAQHTR